MTAKLVDIIGIALNASQNLLQRAEDHMASSKTFGETWERPETQKEED